MVPRHCSLFSVSLKSKALLNESKKKSARLIDARSVRTDDLTNQ